MFFDKLMEDCDFFFFKLNAEINVLNATSLTLLEFVIKTIVS